jgi:MFS family permease
LIGGALADSRDGRRVLFLSRTALALTSIVAAVLVSTGNVELGHLLLYVLLVVGIAAIDMPVSRTLVHKIVGSPRLLGASATQSILMNVVNIVAPVSIGLLIGLAGPGAAFWLLGGGYVLAAAMVVNAPEKAEAPASRALSPLADVIEGVSYIRRTPAVAALLGLGFLVPVAGVYFAMVPVLAREVLQVGPGGLGILVASFSAGSLLGSVYLAVNGSPRRRGLRLTQLGVLFGAGMMAFALSQSFLLSCSISFLLGVTAGFWQNMLSAMSDSCRPVMRGRVVSVFTMVQLLALAGWWRERSVAWPATKRRCSPLASCSHYSAWPPSPGAERHAKSTS